MTDRIESQPDPVTATNQDSTLEGEINVKKGPLIWSIIIILLALAVFFISFKLFGATNLYPVVDYNGFQFTKIENMWYTELKLGDKLVTLPLRFNPLEVSNTSIRGRLNTTFNRNDVYITFDPRNDTGSNFTVLALAAAELGLSLTKAMNLNLIASCAYNSSDICDGRPTVTCDEINKSVIMLLDVGTPEILLYNDCVVLKGYGINLLKSVDRFLYQWYGIIKETPTE